MKVLSNGMIIKSSQEHTELAAQFLAAYPNAKWEILWSISSDIDFGERLIRADGCQNLGVTDKDSCNQVIKPVA